MELYNFIIIIKIIIINFCLSHDLLFLVMFDRIIRNGYVLVLRKLFLNMKLLCL